MSKRFHIPLIITTLLVVGFLGGFLATVNEGNVKAARRQRAHDQGRRAALLHAPSYGNPYQGTEGHIDESVEWCEGWIEGRKELERRASE